MNINAKIVLSVVLSLIAILTIMFDAISPKSNQYFFSPFNNEKYFLIKKITYTISIILLIVIISYSVFSGSIKKQSLSDLSYLLLLFQYFGVASFLYGWTSNSKFGKIIGSISLLILFISEARAFAVIGLIGLLIIRFYNHKIFSKSTVKISVFILFIFLGAFIPRYGSKILEAKNDGKLIPYLSVLFGSYEFGQISYNMNAAVDSNYESKHNLFSLYASVVPIANKFYGEREMGRFHEHIEKYLNPGFSYGLGGTFWGESFVLGGIIGLFISMTTIFYAIRFIKVRIFRGDIFYPIYLLTLIFITFYLPRNDLYIFVAVIKNLFFIIILYLSIIVLIRKNSIVYL